MDNNKELRIAICTFIVCTTLLVIACTTINHIKIPFIVIFLWGAITPFVARKIADCFTRID